MKKRFTAVLAVVCLLCSLLSLSVSAAGNDVTLSMNTVYGMAGDTVEVTLSVSDGHYMTCGQIAVFYDPEQLVLVTNDYDEYTEANEDVLGGASYEVGVPNEGEFYFVFASTSSVGVAEGGEVFTLTFEVLEGFDGDEAVTLYVEELIANDGVTKNGRDYEPDVITQDGNVLARPMGDIDADGMHTVNDAVRLFYHVAGLVKLDAKALNAADVIADGEINIFDATAIYQNLNGKIDLL